MWNKITYPFPNFDGYVILAHTLLGMWLFIHGGILSWFMFVKGAPGLFGPIFHNHMNAPASENQP